MAIRKRLLSILLGASLVSPMPLIGQESANAQLLDWEKVEMTTFIQSGFYPTETMRFWSLRGERAKRDIKDALSDLFGKSASVEYSSGTLNGMPFRDYKIVKTNYFLVKNDPQRSSYSHLSKGDDFDEKDRMHLDNFLESANYRTGDILTVIPSKERDKFKKDLVTYVGERGIVESSDDESLNDDNSQLKIYRR